MARRLDQICVYAGSQTGSRPVYMDAARTLGKALAAEGIGVVFGGGRVGLMGALAEAALESGGRVTGVIPAGLKQRELAHEGVDELIVVGSMHERKARMAELADGFISLPGGFGTLEETIEILTWGQLGIHHKPCGLLNVAGYYDGLLATLEHFVAEGLLREVHRSLLISREEVRELLAAMRAYTSPVSDTWLEQDET